MLEMFFFPIIEGHIQSCYYSRCSAQKGASHATSINKCMTFKVKNMLDYKLPIMLAKWDAL